MSAAPLRAALLPLTALVGYCLTLGLLLSVILPSFFVLLLLRTRHVETQSAAFGVRQSALLSESRWQSVFRWARIVARAAPMVAFLVGAPAVLVLQVLPGAGPAAATGAVTGFVCAVLVLQVGGQSGAVSQWRVLTHVHSCFFLCLFVCWR